MNRIRMALVGLILALGLASVPLAHSAFAAHKGAAKLTNPAGSVKAMANRGNGMLTYVASVLGVTPAALQTDLAAGQTLLQIAGSKYANADALATALLAPVKTSLDKATSSNKLSATQASTLYTQAHTAIATLVVTPHPKLGAILGAAHGARGTHGSSGKLGALSTLTTACNTTAAALRTAVSAGGKSLLAICQATNPSVTQAGLVSTLLTSIKTKLDGAVTAKNITTAQESTMLTRAQVYLTTLVTTTIPVGGLHHHK